MERTIYLDHAATTPVSDEVLNAMLPYFKENYGNPSAIYNVGTQAKKALENAREQVANALNAKPQEIYFTSGGSESDNLAIKGIARGNKSKGNHIITSKIEHHAVLNTCKTLENEGFSVTYLNVDSNGSISLNELERAITNKTILISIMYANNEIGTIEPINEIGKIAKKYNIYFHTDAVQATGNVRIDVNRSNIDLLSISGHKLYAPKGVGAIYIRDGVNILKIQDGGHQEKDKRAGTENISGIVGLGKAIEIANYNLNEYSRKLTQLREYYFTKVQREIRNVKINGDRINRLPGNANVSFIDVNGLELLYNLSLNGICASAGSACSTASKNPSHVLTAIGLTPKMAESSIRITLGKENTKEDIDYLIDKLKEIINKLK